MLGHAAQTPLRGVVIEPQVPVVRVAAECRSVRQRAAGLRAEWAVGQHAHSFSFQTDAQFVQHRHGQALAQGAPYLEPKLFRHFLRVPEGQAGRWFPLRLKVGKKPVDSRGE